MHRPLPRPRQIPILLLVAVLAMGLTAAVSAQSQEPKPALPATAAAEPTATGTEVPLSGVSGTSWQGPNWGVRVTWDPNTWTVENEYITQGYDGLQLGTPISSVFIEGIGAYDGDPAACLADAGQQLQSREGVTEVTPLNDRPSPSADAVRGPSQLYGLVVTLPDGTPIRILEYIECRTVVPGAAVLELTWQTPTGGFNEDFPNVQTLFAAVNVPGQAAATPIASPVAPATAPGPPLATPVA
jgi:hypothetical protein